MKIILTQGLLLACLLATACNEASAPTTSRTEEGSGGPAQTAEREGVFIWKGPWNKSTGYNVDEVVSHNGSSYIAILTSFGIEPKETSSCWILFARAGSRGGPINLYYSLWVPCTDDSLCGRDLYAAVENMLLARPSGPLQILLEPGTYDLKSKRLILDEGVAVKGAGKGLTTIKGSLSPLVTLLENSRLQDLSLVMDDKDDALALSLIKGTGIPRVLGVEVRIFSSRGTALGLSVETGPGQGLVIEDMDISINGEIAIAARSNASLLDWNNINITVRGDSAATGLLLRESSGNIHELTLETRAADSSFGVLLSESDMEFEAAAIESKTGAGAIGLVSRSSSFLIRNSRIHGEVIALTHEGDSSLAVLQATEIKGTALNAVCLSSYTSGYKELDRDCKE